MSSSPERRRGDYAELWDHIKNQKHLIHSTEHHIVFIDTDGDVDWETSRQYDASGHKNLAKHNAILNEAALLEATPCHGLAADTRLHFKRLIGEAIARSFEHDYSSATKMLETAGNYVLARSQETSRFWYLSASFVTTAPFILAGVVLWLCRDAVDRVFGVGFLWLALSAVAGAMGALLSVIARTGKLKFDCSAGRELHYLEGASRICAGALSGIVVALAIRTEMLLAPLARGEKAHAVMMVAALAAGAGERLATSIISSIDAAHAKNSPDRHIPKSEEATDD